MNGVHSSLTNGSINFIFQFTPTTLTGLHVWASYSGKWPLTSDCGVCSGGGGGKRKWNEYFLYTLQAIQV